MKFVLVPVLIAAGLSLSSPVQASPTTQSDCASHIVTHRTNASNAPENTLAGIDSAATTGASWVEMDVRWSNSHFPVLMHDPTVDRTTNGTGAVANTGLNALLALKAQDYAPWNTSPIYNPPDGTTQYVSYAWSFLNESLNPRAFKGNRLGPNNTELPEGTALTPLNMLLHISTDTPPSAADTDKLSLYIDSYFPGSADHIVIQGAYDVIQAMRAERPNYHYALIEYNSSTMMRRPSSVLALGVHDYVIPAGDVDPDVVAWYHHAGITVWSWSSDTAAMDTATTWSRLWTAGVDYLITNKPVEALAACSAAG